MAVIALVPVAAVGYSSPSNRVVAAPIRHTDQDDSLATHRGTPALSSIIRRCA